MLLSNYVTELHADFANLSALASEESAALITKVAATLIPSYQSQLLDALSQVVQEYNLDSSSPLTLTIEGDDVRLAHAAQSEPEEAPSTSSYSARIALRLSDDLKEQIERLAGELGTSVNSWIVRSLERAVRQNATGSSFLSHRQLRGRGRA